MQSAKRTIGSERWFPGGALRLYRTWLLTTICLSVFVAVIGCNAKQEVEPNEEKVVVSADSQTNPHSAERPEPTSVARSDAPPASGTSEVSEDNAHNGSSRETETKDRASDAANNPRKPEAKKTPASVRAGPRPSTKGNAHDVHVHANASAVPSLLLLYDSMGIDRVVNLSGGNQSRGFKASLAVLEETKGRVVPFYNLDWNQIESGEDGSIEAVADDFEAAIEAGYGGLKISKFLGLGAEIDGKRLPVDDPRLDPIFERAGTLGVPVFIHTSDPKAFFEPVDEKNERYAELSAHPSWSFYGDEYPSRNELLEERNRRIARHSKTTFVCVHLANNPEDVDAVDAFLEAHPNAYADVSARLGEFGRHDATKVRDFFVKHADRVLFGTDFMIFISRNGRASVTMGSGKADDPLPTLDDIHAFFGAHWRYFESDEASIPNPVPIQGDWDIHPIALPEDVLEKLYYRNAERLVFAPYDERNSAKRP